MNDFGLFSCKSLMLNIFYVIYYCAEFIFLLSLSILYCIVISHLFHVILSGLGFVLFYLDVSYSTVNMKTY